MGNERSLIKFIAGKYCNQEYEFKMGKNKLVCLTEWFGKKVYMTDFAKIDIANQETTMNSNSGLGSALVGGALAGGVGAVVGAVAGKKISSDSKITLNVQWKNGETSIAIVNSTMYEALMRVTNDPNGFLEAQKSYKRKARIVFIIIIVVWVYVMYKIMS